MFKSLLSFFALVKVRAEASPRVLSPLLARRQQAGRGRDALRFVRCSEPSLAPTLQRVGQCARARAALNRHTAHRVEGHVPWPQPMRVVTAAQLLEHIFISASNENRVRVPQLKASHVFQRGQR